MYKLPYYIENDREKIIAFMNENRFAVVAGLGEQYPVASHLPLAIEVKGDTILLHGHLMKHSDHHLAFKKNKHVLVIFNGPHCYVSAAWYTNPQIASTWNYMAVHAKGTIRFTDEDGTYHAVKKITEQYESPESAAAFDKLPEDYIRQMVKAINGFTITVERWDAVFKLSQNRDKVAIQNIIEQLQKRNDEDSKKIAAEMQSRLTQ